MPSFFCAVKLLLCRLHTPTSIQNTPLFYANDQRFLYKRGGSILKSGNQMRCKQWSGELNAA